MDEPAFLDRRPLPALVHSSSGPLLPHVSVLDEALSPAGLLLWEILRDAALWGTAAPDRREGLFADGARTLAGTVPELEEELGALAVLVRDPHPDAGPVIAHLCSRVAAWAEGQGLGGTALAFAQGAALADASDARLAYEVGRLSRVRAEYVRAEAWYQRALVLAARGGDKETQARTYGGLVNIHGLRGNHALEMTEASLAGKSILAAKTLLASLGGEGIRPALPAVTDESTMDFARDLVRALRMHPIGMDEVTLLLADVIKKPEDPQPGYAFARALRSMAEYERAEAWFGHTIRLAQRSGDAMMEARCLGGLGNLYSQRGDLLRAYDLHQSHLEFARRERLGEMEGLALIDLCMIGFAADRGDDGFAHAREALHVLGSGHRLLPRLGHDLATYLMENRKDFESALLLFRALKNSEFPPEDRVLLEASLARAAAGAGEAQAFEEGWTAVWSAMEKRTASETNAGALIQIAHGALMRGLYGHAEQAARRAQAAAVERGEAQLASTAENLLEAAAFAAETHERPGLRRDPTHDARSAQRLARGIATALRPKRRKSNFGISVSTLRGDLT